MSSVTIQGNPSGTGIFTVASPNSNTNQTLVLPNASGTLLTNSGTEAGAFSTLSVAGNNISAQNSLGFRNRIINGGMVIDQRNAGAAVTASTTAFSCDRWKAYRDGSGTLTYAQSSVVPNGNFTNSILVTVTGTGTPGEAAIVQHIEGFNIGDLGFGTANAVPLTASFWVRSSVTGTYCFSLRQGSGARSFVSPFTISSANAWQQVTVAIPGDTSGTYNTTNGTGFIFEVCIGATTLQTSTTNAWQAGNFVCTSAQTNLASTNGATFYITGVQLEAGPVATPFERRDYGRELIMCNRYYQILDINGQTLNLYPGSGFGYAGNTFDEMRATPIIIYDTSFPNSGAVYTTAGGATPVTYINNAAATPRSISWATSRTSGSWPAGEVCGHTYVRIRLSSEL